MQRCVSLRRMAGVLLGLVLYFLLTVPWVQAATRTLPKDAKLHPQGWAVGDLIQFKKGTTVSTNDLGEVVSGTLADDTLLQPRGWERVIDDYYYVSAYTDLSPYFPRYPRFFAERKYNMAIPGYGHLLYKGGSTVTFSEKGEVLAGTIAEPATVRLVAGKYGFVTFKPNTALAFYDSGALLSGVLDADTNLRPVGWAANNRADDSAGFIKFSGKKNVVFSENGEVISGTLKEPVKWHSTEGPVREFSAQSSVHFYEQGTAAEKAD
ncbi:MAG TPA: hypothetical protein PKA28_13960 [Methylomusa anaerophila]|uniref:Uncharacterized protein n=1 Tax=Methylomusa anaerophila TaxID=1930071 RepID=A0A348AKC1_9FIRM|nr:hypothetical protein [Methylomusa anaerophila]BBB91519.1 hypothetical protein MAMMFC1_02203 [Methylomusa anaerophila]HML89543.1 hypothetical protein [Methylomusa anaerophila]